MTTRETHFTEEKGLSFKKACIPDLNKLKTDSESAMTLVGWLNFSKEVGTTNYETLDYPLSLSHWGSDGYLNKEKKKSFSSLAWREITKFH